MQAIARASAGVAAACALTAATATSAAAADTSWQVSVEPRTVAPGGTVTLTSSGCQVPTVTADAGVFDTTELNEGHSATAKVFEDAKPAAEYDVTFTCNGQTKSAPLMIADHGSGVHKGVKAGGGGSFASFSVTQLALGGALVAGALGVAVHYARRRGFDES
ncbi:hypothetical protein ACFQVC_36395 [Streptomyces monticola]|uniref:Lipoprotein n=1 Tax=Streptomyces monticola TaxID=2666263 RepID=A0ABW2JW77_9ACTN